MSEAGSGSLGIGERLGVTFMAALILVAVLANLSGVLVILRCSNLRHSLPNFFVLNLCLADLAAAIFVLPLAAASFYLKRWTWGWGLCAAAGFLTSLFSFASIASLCVISMERFYSIRLPMRHAANMTLARTLAVIAAVWTQSALLASLPLIGVNSYEFRQHKRLCSFTWDGGGSHEVYAVVVATWCFLLPAAILTLMYCGIYRVAHQSVTQVRPEPTLSAIATPTRNGATQAAVLARVTVKAQCSPLSASETRFSQSRDPPKLPHPHDRSLSQFSAPCGERDLRNGVNDCSGRVPLPQSTSGACSRVTFPRMAFQEPRDVANGDPRASEVPSSALSGCVLPTAPRPKASGTFHVALSGAEVFSSLPQPSPLTPRPTVSRSLSQVSSWSEGNKPAVTWLADLLESERPAAEPHSLDSKTDCFLARRSSPNAASSLAAQRVLPALSEGCTSAMHTAFPSSDLPCKDRLPKILPPRPSHLTGASEGHCRSLPSLRHFRTSPRPRRKKSRKPCRSDNSLSQDCPDNNPEPSARGPGSAPEPSRVGNREWEDLRASRLEPNLPCQVGYQMVDENIDETAPGCAECADGSAAGQKGVRVDADARVSVQGGDAAKDREEAAGETRSRRQSPKELQPAFQASLRDGSEQSHVRPLTSELVGDEVAEPSTHPQLSEKGCDCPGSSPHLRSEAKPGQESKRPLLTSSDHAVPYTPSSLTSGQSPGSRLASDPRASSLDSTVAEATDRRRSSRQRQQIQVNYAPAFRHLVPSGSSSVSFSAPSRAVVGGVRGSSRRRSGLHVKAITNLLVVTATFLLLWGPYFLLQLQGVVSGSVQTPDVTELLAIWLGFSTFAVNPFLYCWLNRAIRTELVAWGWGLFCCRCRCRCRKGRGEEEGRGSQEEGPTEGEDFFQFLERTSTAPLSPPQNGGSRSQGEQSLHCPTCNDETSSTWF